MPRKQRTPEVSGPVLNVTVEEGKTVVYGHDEQGNPAGPYELPPGSELRLVLRATKLGYLQVLTKLLDRSEREAFEAKMETQAHINANTKLATRIGLALELLGQTKKDAKLRAILMGEES